ncbi:hypothetical protein EDC04DRAFT_2636269 [Pisolithus marmoratus]|nr:hypothetical protein EDC04DRAFT_2636269 [Pisolithus marmoratus]
MYRGPLVQVGMMITMLLDVLYPACTLHASCIASTGRCVDETQWRVAMTYRADNGTNPSFMEGSVDMISRSWCCPERRTALHEGHDGSQTNKSDKFSCSHTTYFC